mmetsp:Transcript_514/g.1208  ORF Transcript_514/g.1208 Transcript_514/m.1208 type:complete len:434 (+) Transcript_514:63-1364(+)
MSISSQLSSSRDDLFIEVINNIRERRDDSDPFVEVVASAIRDPKQVSSLLKELKHLLPIREKQQQQQGCFLNNGTTENDADPPLYHLKRVRRYRHADASSSHSSANKNGSEQQRIAANDACACHDENISRGEEQVALNLQNNNSPPPKKQKKASAVKKTNGSTTLEVILGTAFMYYEKMAPEERARIEEKFGLTPFYLQVPSRPAKSAEEHARFTAIWPIIYNQERTDEFKHDQNMLTGEDVRRMEINMRAAVHDARRYEQQLISHRSLHGLSASAAVDGFRPAGVVIVDPLTGKIVSEASDERVTTCANTNPTHTAILLAIQGVSRKERKAATKHKNGMESEEFRKGQYLCTGYDVYVTREPNVFESMALVHSRVRSVIFGVADGADGGLGGSRGGLCIHSLPGTNHNYRAFRLRDSFRSDLLEACENLSAN